MTAIAIHTPNSFKNLRLREYPVRVRSKKDKCTIFKTGKAHITLIRCTETTFFLPYLPLLELSRSDTDSKTDSRCQWQDERCIRTAIDNNCLFRIMVVKADKPENAYPPFRIFKKNFRNQKKLLSGICSIISETSHFRRLQRRSIVQVLTTSLCCNRNPYKR